VVRAFRSKPTDFRCKSVRSDQCQTGFDHADLWRWRGLGKGAPAVFRTLIAYRAKTRSVFLFGLAKSEWDNVDDDELVTLRDVARSWLAADLKALAKAIAGALIQEVRYEEEKRT
jgi:hypothetical protein